MARNRKMAELRGRHAQKIDALFREFLQRNPAIDPHLGEDTWTPEQTQQWRLFTTDEDTRFAKKREKLANRLRAEHRNRLRQEGEDCGPLTT
jgi:hypothetical protein